jgi:hypothetical protein
MKRSKNQSETFPVDDIIPARSPKEWEDRCIGEAYKLEEKRLKEGTATAAETVHFLKLGSTKERLEREKMEKEINVLSAKAEAYESAKRIEELYSSALTAMRTYSGQESEDEQ